MPKSAGLPHCGRGLPVLRRILGKQRNLMVLPDGTRRWPLTGFHGYRDVAPVLQYQFVQVDLATVEINLVVERPLNSGEETALREVILAALGHPFNVVFKYYASELPRSANGKFDEFVCRVA